MRTSEAVIAFDADAPIGARTVEAHTRGWFGPGGKVTVPFRLKRFVIARPTDRYSRDAMVVSLLVDDLENVMAPVPIGYFDPQSIWPFPPLYVGRSFRLTFSCQLPSILGNRTRLTGALFAAFTDLMSTSSGRILKSRGR